MGFSEEEIQNVRNRSEKIRENRKLMTEEEKAEITTSVEEFFKEWGESDNIN